MQKIFKYILTCLWLSCVFVNARAAEKSFDLIDVNTGHVSFQQGRSHETQHIAGNVQHKSVFAADHSKQGKKYARGKHVTFAIHLSLPVKTRLDIEYAPLVLLPRTSSPYDYLFYREINPPPPKSC
ncbi:MAG: hypothetical protein JSS82_09420 [Bacteroidetes bacterium]|nr:hypothetical protein [Bacteroidota bacterium]